MPEITPIFVDTIPGELEDGRLYISLQYRTITHKCACGCGVEINTPLHPTGWKLTYDGVNVSLSPSVGNWSEQCQSHYWIEKNQIRWSFPWKRAQILAGRKRRTDEIEEYFGTVSDEATIPPSQKTTRLTKWLYKRYYRFRILWKQFFG